MFKLLLINFIMCYAFWEILAVTRGPPCPTIKLQNGRVRYRQRSRFVKFICNTGFIIAGEKYSTCQQGKWDTAIPKCVRGSCTKVQPPMNGLIYPSHRNAVLNFFCKPGFELRGPNITYCDGKKWDNNLPTCTRSNTKPSVSCDFESVDLCGWNHDLRHDFDWRRMNFKTPSGHIGTGPNYDHTKGENRDGFYMYIESTSRNENDTARLISPIYDKTSSEACFEFYYHMYGITTGQLRVYIKKMSDSWDLDPEKAIFWKTGNQGNRWFRSYRKIGIINEDFQIIIEGVRGPGYVSDIAVDDVFLIENCTDDKPTTASYTDDTDIIPLPVTQSCINRCDNDNFIVYPDANFVTCDCDEMCIEKSSCCPDYAAICVLAATDDISTDETTSSIVMTITGEYSTDMDDMTTVTAATFPRATTRPAPSAFIPTMPVKIIMPVGLKNITNTNATTVATTTISNNIPDANRTTKFHVTPQKWIPTLRPLIFLKAQTTQPIIEKILDYTQTTRTTNAVTRSTTINMRKTSKKIYDIIPVPTNPQYQDNINEVPTKITKKVEMNSAMQNEITLQKDSNKINDLNALFSGTQNDKIVKEKVNSKATSLIIIASSAFLILLTVLITLFMFKRYGSTSCIKMTKMKSSSNGDSQSDVRFLTGDEVLDFNIAHPDDDDEV